MNTVEEIRLRFRACPPVDPKTFVLAEQLASEAFAGRLPSISDELARSAGRYGDIGDIRLAFTLNDHPMTRAAIAIEHLAKSKERDPEKADGLASALHLRHMALHILFARYFHFLKQHDLLHEDGDTLLEHTALIEVGATLPLNEEGTYDVVAFFTALNKLLDDPVPMPAPVSGPPQQESADLVAAAKQLEEQGLLKVHAHRTVNKYARAVEELLELFVVLRTVTAKADPAKGCAKTNEVELADEISEWTRSNPLLTSEDLACLKKLLRGEGYPKLVWQNILSDARGKRLNDLYPLLYAECQN